MIPQFSGALMRQAELTDILRACHNPMYPSQSDYGRLRQHMRTFKGYRRLGWLGRYQQWANDHEALRGME